jgi:hypothetical protein
MQLVLIGGAFIAVGSIFVSCKEIPVSLEQTAKEQFKKLPGTIGITLQNYEGTWHLRITMGQISRVDTLPRAQKEARSSGLEVYQGAPHLPGIDGYFYSGPYAVSPDNRLIIASLTAKGTAPIYPTAFVIADNSSRQIVSGPHDTGNYNDIRSCVGSRL